MSDSETGEAERLDRQAENRNHTRMYQDVIPSQAYVIKATELAALNYLSPGHPVPQKVEWINRGTDQHLKISTFDMLMRTLFQEVTSASVKRLHEAAGLRAIFRTEKERNRFAAAFDDARSQETECEHHVITAIFGDRAKAEMAVSELKAAGLPGESISLLWRASQFMDTNSKWCEGHSSLSVASAATGGGIAGAMLGIAILTIPGVGPVAAAGALAASAFSSVAAVSGVIGATGGAIARMLTDHDVDGVLATIYEQQIRRGKIFVSVDTSLVEAPRNHVQRILRQAGGHNFKAY